MKIKVILSCLLSISMLTACSSQQENTTKSIDSEKKIEQKSNEFKLGVLPPSEWQKNFKLKDHHGKERQLSDFKGKVVGLFFGYTHCPDVCPTTLGLFREVITKLKPEDAKRFQVLFVTVDPERDTPELLSQFVPAFHDSFLGMYTTPEQTKIISKQFHIFYQTVKTSNPSVYNIDHSTTGYLIDPQGNMKLFFDLTTQPKDLIHG